MTQVLTTGSRERGIPGCQKSFTSDVLPSRRTANTVQEGCTLPRLAVDKLKELQNSAHAAGKKASDVLLSDPPKGQASRDAAIDAFRDAHLALGRGLATIDRRNALPGRIAHQVHARLVLSTMLMMDTPCEPPLTAQDAEVFSMFCAAAQHFNALVRLGGVPPSHMLNLTTNWPGDWAALQMGEFLRGNAAITFDPGAFWVHPSVMRHESAHGETINVARVGDASQAEFNTDQHSRSLTLAAARYMEGAHEWPDTDWEFSISVGEEVHAYLSNAQVDELIAPYKGSMKRTTGLPTGCGLEKLVPMIVQAMRPLLMAPESTCPPVMALASEKGYEARPTFYSPENARMAERIHYDVYMLNQAMRSQAWTADQSQALRQLMTDLDAKLKDSSEYSALQTIGRELNRFVDELQQTHGAALQVPADAPVDPGELQRAHQWRKGQPLDVLATLVARFAPDATPPGQSPLAHVSTAMSQAKQDSGFLAAVERLRKAGTQPKKRHVAEAIMRLAAHYMDYPSLRHVPKDLWPEVDIVDVDQPEDGNAPTFPLVPGLNGPLPRLDDEKLLHSYGEPAIEQALRKTYGDIDLSTDSHLKDKADFEQTPWACSIPRYLFSEKEADRLEERLASVAARLAYTVVAATAHRAPEGTMDARTVGASNLIGPWRSMIPAKVLAAIGLESNRSLRSLHNVKPKLPFVKPPALDADTRYSSPTQALSTAFVLNPSRDMPPSGPAPAQLPSPRKPGKTPFAAAQILRILAGNTEQLDPGLLWSKGDRSILKAAMNAGEKGARQAFQAQSIPYHELPWVAWFRAAKAA